MLKIARKLYGLMILICLVGLLLSISPVMASSVSKQDIRKMDNAAFMAALIKFKESKSGDYAVYSMFYDECKKRKIDYDEEMEIIDPVKLRELSADQFKKVLEKYHSKERVAGNNAKTLIEEGKRRKIDFNSFRKIVYTSLREMPDFVFIEELKKFRKNPGESKWDSNDLVRECKLRGINFVTGKRVAKSVGSSTAATLSQIELIIRKGCEKKWGENYRMVVFCINQQRKSVVQLALPCGSQIPVRICDGIKAKCAAKWGDNFRMILFCVQQQSAAYLSLQ